MKLGWLSDKPGYIGGAELTMQAFRKAAPTKVETIHLPPGRVDAGYDGYVIGNCVSYSLEDIQPVVACDGPVIKYVNDVWPHGDPLVRDWLLHNAVCVFTSPLHAERFPHHLAEPPVVIPPPIDLDAYRVPRQSRKRREGAVSINAWHNPGKGQQRLVEWSEQHAQEVDVYGDGPYVPHGRYLNQKGVLKPEKVAQALWRYQTFIHLPTELEPFGRGVVEAWAAGCDLVVNGLVGARYFIEEAPGKLATATDDFWALVTA